MDQFAGQNPCGRSFQWQQQNFAFSRGARKGFCAKNYGLFDTWQNTIGSDCVDVDELMSN